MYKYNHEDTYIFDTIRRFTIIKSKLELKEYTRLRDKGHHLEQMCLFKLTTYLSIYIHRQQC